MLIKIVLGMSALAAVLVLAVARQPSEYRVARTATIAASPAALFPHVEDLRTFNVWNPWIKLDPAATVTFDGPPAGSGATMAWAGNKNVGEGRMTVIESRPHERVRFRLDFLKPFASTATAEFAFVPDGERTTVTWAMTGRHTWAGKVMGLVMNMDRMIGGQFEKGLADLKSLTEATAKESGR